MSPTLRRLVVAATAAALCAAPLAAPTVATAAASEPDVVALAGPLASQQLSWHTCAYDPSYDPATVDWLNSVPGTACATVTVPRDWHHPADGHTITIEVSRTRTSTGNPDRQGIALVNPGGPGGTGLEWGPAMALTAPALAQAYDFIGFDPRGVGQSTPLLCEVTYDPQAPVDDQTRAMVAGCLANPLTPFITTEQTTYDMDFIRALLGEPRTSVYGYSYGTWLGAWYGSTFPSRTHRLVLDSSTQVTDRSLQSTWDVQPQTRDRQFQQHLLPYMARNPQVFGMGTDALAIRRAWERAGGTRELLGQLATAFFIIPAMYNNANYPVAGKAVALVASGNFAGMTTPAALDALVARLVADPGLTAEQRTLVEKGAVGARDRLQRTAVVTETYEGAFSAIRCQDGPWNQSLGYWGSWLRGLDAKAPFIAPFMSTPECAWWPSQATMPKAKQQTAPPALLLQAELDAATGYELGLASAKARPNTWMISVDNEGSHGVYPYMTTCVDDQVEAFLLRGTIPGQRFGVCGAKPLPGEAETFQVGADLGGNGKLNVKTVPKEVREANKFVRSLLAEQAATP